MNAESYSQKIAIVDYFELFTNFHLRGNIRIFEFLELNV